MWITLTVEYCGSPVTIRIREVCESWGVGSHKSPTQKIDGVCWLEGRIQNGWPHSLVCGSIFALECSEIAARFILKDNPCHIKSSGLYRVQALEELHKLEKILGVKFEI